MNTVNVQGVTHHQHGQQDSIHLPPSTKHLPPEHGILLTPESVGTQQIGENGSARTDARKRFAKNIETEDRVGVLGVLQAEKLGDEDSEEGQRQGGPEVSEIGPLESFWRQREF